MKDSWRELPTLDRSDSKATDHLSSSHPQVAGFPIFGCAQPTEEGFDSVLAKIPGGVRGQAVRTIWYNMRQEPVVYLDGMPYAPRQPDR